MLFTWFQILSKDNKIDSTTESWGIVLCPQFKKNTEDSCEIEMTAIRKCVYMVWFIIKYKYIYILDV